MTSCTAEKTGTKLGPMMQPYLLIALSLPGPSYVLKLLFGHKKSMSSSFMQTILLNVTKII